MFCRRAVSVALCADMECAKYEIGGRRAYYSPSNAILNYAVTLIEDNARYGWMSDNAKDVFYDELDKLHPAPEPELEANIANYDTDLW